jgi:hypothetical protein
MTPSGGSIQNRLGQHDNKGEVWHCDDPQLEEAIISFPIDCMLQN